MKLVVGLGNPGRKYDGTRHNVGFEVIAELARRYDVGRAKAKFDGEMVEARIGNTKTILLCPLTFMNLSGRCVQPVVDFYKIPIEDVLIICDDFNLALARLRIKPNGSAGGQNGLKDIIQRLGTKDVPRLRIGIGTPPPRWDVADYVLGKFDNDDLVTMENGVKRAADATEMWISEGIQPVMNKYNADPTATPKAKKSATQKSSESGDSEEVNDGPKSTGPKTDENNDTENQEQKSEA